MKHAVLSLLMLWTAIYGLAVYAYGLTGVLSGLSYDKYQGKLCRLFSSLDGLSWSATLRFDLSNSETSPIAVKTWARGLP